MSKNKMSGDGKMDSLQIRRSPEGLCIETDNRSVLISDKDLPLVFRGQARPLRDMDHKSIGQGNYALTRAGNLVIRLNGEERTIPGRVWMAARSGIRRVILSSSPQVVTA